MRTTSINVIPVGKRPPGYPRGHRFVLRTAYKKGRPGVFCPVIGCLNTTVFLSQRGSGLNKHMKVFDHSKCADLSKINVLDRDENLLHDISNNVLVCIRSQEVLFQHEFPHHAQLCEKCQNVNPDTIPIELSTSLSKSRKMAVQGILIQQNGNFDYQVIQGKKRYIDRPFTNRPAIQLTTDPDCDHSEELPPSHVGDLPPYLKPSLLEFLHVSDQTLIDVVNTTYDDNEQYLYTLSCIYFLVSYIALNTTSYPQFRANLRERWNISQVKAPFQQLATASTALQYMKVFCELNIYMFRDYKLKKVFTGPGIDLVKEVAEMTANKDNSIEDIKKKLIEELPDIHNLQPSAVEPEDLRHCYPPIDETKDWLLDKLKVGSYNFEFLEPQLSCLHRLWLDLLLQSAKSTTPLYFQAIGFKLRGGRLGLPLNVDSANMALSAMIFSLRLVIWQELTKRNSDDAHCVAHNLWRHSLYNDTGFSASRLLYKLSDDVAKSAKSQHRHTCQWDNFANPQAIIYTNNNVLELDNLKSGVSCWVNDLVLSLNGLVFDASIETRFNDSPGCDTPGYTFFDPKAVHLYDHVMKENSEILTNMSALEKYCKDANTFLISLMTLIHISCMGSPRATEMFEWTFRNTNIMRTFTLEETVSCFVLNYHKTKFMKDRVSSEGKLKSKLYIPWILTELVTRYLSLVRPFVSYIWTEIFGLPIYDQFKYNFCCYPEGPWSSSVLLDGHKKYTEKYFGVIILYSDWRHTMELMFTRFDKILPETTIPVLEICSRFLNHSIETAAQNYATSSVRRPDTSDHHSAISRALAQAYHTFLEYPAIEKKYEAQFYKPKSSIIPITHRSIGTPNLSENPQKPKNTFKYLLEMFKRKNPTIVNPTTEFLRDPTLIPVWKSSYQSFAFELALKGNMSFIAILPTGGGKTAIYELPLYFEKYTHTIIVVPFLSLKVELIDRLTASKIKVTRADSASYDDNNQVHVVTYEGIQGIYHIARHWLSQNILKRIVFDEAHTLVTARSFRAEVLNPILLLDVQRIFLSATIPLEFEGEFARMAKCRLVSVRHPFTFRPNICYKVIQCKSIMSASAALTMVAHDFVKKFREDSTARMLIYLHNKKNLAPVKLLMPVGVTHEHYFATSSDSERDRVYKGFVSGSHNTVIATSAFSTGIDYPNVTHVIHWLEFLSMVEFDQSSGRAGRNGNPATSYFISIPSHTEYSPLGAEPFEFKDKLAAINYFNEPVCRRRSRSKFLDGIDFTCQDDKECVLCDLCAERANQPASFDTLEHESRRAAYDSNLEILRNSLATKPFSFCLRKNEYVDDPMPCHGVQEMFRQKIRPKLMKGYCFSCGMKETSMTGLDRHSIKGDTCCPFQHCMKEAMVWCYHEFQEESLNFYKLTPETVQIVKEAVFKTKRNLTLASSTWYSTSHINSGDMYLTAAAISVVFRLFLGTSFM